MATHRDVFDPTDPTDLLPEHRQHEVAAILAAMTRMGEKRGPTPAPIVPRRLG